MHRLADRVVLRVNLFRLAERFRLLPVGSVLPRQVEVDFRGVAPAVDELAVDASRARSAGDEVVALVEFVEGLDEEESLG